MIGHDVYPIELESEEVPVTILPFPREGRPVDFQGTVGNFNFDASIQPSEVKVGDPVTLRMVISGSGNLDTVSAPRLPSDEKFKTYEPEVTKQGRKKIYEQVIIPKTDELTKIPAVSFSFFNPVSRCYQTVRKGPFPVKVTDRSESEKAVKMVSMPGARQMFYPREKLGRDIIHIKENIGKLQPMGKFLYKDWLFWLGQILPFALFMFFYSGYRKKERIRTDKGYARFLKAPRKARKGLAQAKAYLAKNKILPFYDIIFKTLQEYLADRLNLPRGNVTVQIIEERISPSDRDKEVIDMLREVFSKCEMARYASSVPGGEEAEKILDKVKKIIDYMEKVKL